MINRIVSQKTDQTNSEVKLQMTIKKFNPSNVVKPFNNAYHHCVVIPANAETLFISGQLGLNLDGSLPDDPQLEADKAWENVIECVKEAGMGVEDIVKITAFLTDEGDYPYFANSRSKFLGDARPASTAILVKALVKKEWRFEIEAVAAKKL